MPQTQDTDDTVPAVEDFAPRSAGTHVSVITRTAPIVPERRSVWPLAPWRWVLLLTGLALAAVCGIPAADPVVNGADLGVFISLAIFVAAFTPGRD
ncbi:hypothetical protein [Microbacterium algeriense]|uniref:hypothetical protein n=1 Tax=Microbacterium algeriense TaxID=2615184 RepID=UPI0022E834B9|nr:hypothetical protein [Microbacterium algeriense]